MPFTPEEYAEHEMNVSGWTGDEPLYAPGFNKTERVNGMPNLAELLGIAPPPAESTPPQGTETPVNNTNDEAQAMSFEYNFILPLRLRRAEVLIEVAKIAHLSARTRFWRVLSWSVALVPLLVFVAVLVK